MKLGLLKRVLKEDLSKSGEQIPKWIDQFLDPLNVFIERVGLALQNRLTFEDNFLCKLINVEFTSGVELEINPSVEYAQNTRVYGVVPLASLGNAIDHVNWNHKSNGNIGVTVTFVSAASSKVDLLLLLR